ncbi:uncharacterized protein V6R79_014115 [Siganus canaliculatus]
MSTSCQRKLDPDGDGGQSVKFGAVRVDVRVRTKRRKRMQLFSLVDTDSETKD